MQKKSSENRNNRPIWLNIIYSIFCIAIFWVGFWIWTKKFSTAETTALILAAFATLVVILIVYPEILDRIKGVKIGNIEFTLSQSVEEQSLEYNLILAQDEANAFKDKGEMPSLYEEIKQIRRNVHKKIILRVDLKDGNYIIIPMLYLYMWALNYFGDLQALVFISTRERRQDVYPEIYGVISTEKTFRILDKKYPAYRQKLSKVSEELLKNSDLKDLKDIYSDLKNEAEKLNYEIFNELFFEHLDKTVINYPLAKEDYNLILRAIESESDFVILTQKGSLKSIISVNMIARIIAKNSLYNIIYKK